MGIVKCFKLFSTWGGFDISGYAKLGTGSKVKVMWDPYTANTFSADQVPEPDAPHVLLNKHVDTILRLFKEYAHQIGSDENTIDSHRWTIRHPLQYLQDFQEHIIIHGWNFQAACRCALRLDEKRHTQAKKNFVNFDGNWINCETCLTWYHLQCWNQNPKCLICEEAAHIWHMFCAIITFCDGSKRRPFHPLSILPPDILRRILLNY
jgi:hypothetical protein